MIDTEQEIIAFLSDGASYGEPGAAVTRIDTHCSIAFLLRDRAYKLKRPIFFSALDYRTVERRHAACRAELELNRRTAPELYLGMASITACALLNRYLDATGDDKDLAVLPLMMAIRMGTRAFTLAAGSQRRSDPAYARRLQDEARSHIARALSILAKQRPRLVALGGLEGGMKSTLADALATALGPVAVVRVLSTEPIRKNC